MLPDLETARLTLRELSPEDAPALQEWQNSPTQWRLMAVEPAEFSDAAVRIGNYQRYRGEGADRRLFVYSARLKSDDALIGSVSLARSHREIASLELSVAGAHGRQGYGTELVRRILVFGFGDIRLHRIAADVAIENQACVRVMERVGMHREGISRDCIFAQGRWWTEAKYALLASDFRTNHGGGGPQAASA
jgi:RimJ/RimL family protein N-acetyltransferase